MQSVLAPHLESIRAAVAAGATIRDLAEQYNVSQNAVYNFLANNKLRTKGQRLYMTTTTKRDRARFYLRLPLELRAKWQAQATAEGLALSDWIIKQIEG